MQVDNYPSTLEELDAAIHHSYRRMVEFRHHEEHGLAQRCEAMMNGYLDARSAQAV